MFKPKSAKIIVRLINFLTSFDLYNDGDAGAVNQKNLYRQIYLYKLVFLKKETQILLYKCYNIFGNHYWHLVLICYMYLLDQNISRSARLQTLLNSVTAPLPCNKHQSINTNLQFTFLNVRFAQQIMQIDIINTHIIPRERLTREENRKHFFLRDFR